jgi:cell wall-associated NlpC family hydrolase
MILASIAATPALAGVAGGTAAGPSTRAPVVSSTPTSPAARNAPITARSSSLAYRGPVYEKAVTGQIVPYSPALPAGQVTDAGGSPVGVSANTKPNLLVPGSTARVIQGLAAAPMAAPVTVQEVIWAANQIIGLPYIFGGGHNASFISPGYDCSGTVSFALHGASLLAAPADSSEFMHWGSNGIGQWVTIFSNPAHAYMDVAGVRLDTSAADDPSAQQGPRWRPLRHGNGGYKVRHPVGI